ncbi:hypothetical protein ZWY2020_017421 [Hordeum vulgare]|nr:hypothetical protein ZWY2020_017421 [Hordeum vulgare]
MTHSTSSSGSSSSIVAGDVSGYHVLKIVGYSRTKEVPNGKQIESCPFRVGGRTWRLRYCPNGWKPDSTDYISLFLCLDDTVTGTEPVNAQFSFSLLEQDGNQVPSYCTIKNNSEASPARDFAVGKSWGHHNFIKRGELEKSKHLKDDSFTVKVDITVSGFYKQETPSIVVPPSDMHRHFGDLLSSKEGADVEFRVGGETFWAHRYVLAARSPVFRAELFGSMKEGTTKNAIHIDDMEAEVFSNLLIFIYTDDVPPDTSQLDEYAMAQHLLVAADRYGLERLMLICEDKLCNSIDTSSVTTILALAEQHHCHGLKKACLVFLGSLTNLNAVRESEGFDYLTKTMKDLLISKVIAG